MEKKHIKISLGTFIVSIIAVILVAIIVVMGMHILNQNKVIEKSKVVTENKEKESQEEKANNNKVEELDINSELVKKLYAYVNSKYFMPNGEFMIKNGDNAKEAFPVKLFYRENVTAQNLEDDLKILSVCSALYDEKVYTIRKAEGDEDLANENIYVFSVENIQKKAKEMFNTVININKNSYIWTDGDHIDYNEGTNSYEYAQYISGGMSNYFDDFKLIKAEKMNDNIYIYDNYVRIIQEWNEKHFECYATSDENVKLNEFNNFNYNENVIKSVSNLGIMIPIYKHTFKQREDGTYYWVSTELTNKDELKTVDEAESNNDDIVGKWKTYSVKDSKGNEVSLMSFFGSSGKYGSYLQLNEDGTFLDSIYPIMDERESNKGTYEILRDYLKIGDCYVELHYDDGKIKKFQRIYYADNIATLASWNIEDEYKFDLRK